MLEINPSQQSKGASSPSWMRSVWESLWLGAGRFPAPTGCYQDQERAVGDRMKPSPILELAWIEGKPVIMGRNQTMKMLIEGPLPVPRKGLFGLRPKPRLPAVARNAHRPSR